MVISVPALVKSMLVHGYISICQRVKGTQPLGISENVTEIGMVYGNCLTIVNIFDFAFSFFTIGNCCEM